MPEKPTPLIDNIVLWLTEDCNLRCSYCFVKKNKKEISKETAEEVFHFIERNKHLFAKKIILNFTGGEPLMKFDMIKHIVKYYNARNFSSPVITDFSLITNGTLLNDEIIEFMGKNRFSVTCSIDGTPRITEVQRPHKNGKTSYRDDMRYLLTCMKQVNLPAKARLTFMPESLNLVENIRHLAEVGFEKINILTDMEEYWANDDEQATLGKALKSLAEFFLDEVTKGNILKIDIFSEYLLKYSVAKSNGAHIHKTPCPSGKTSIGITVDGDIYPCHHWHNQSNRTQAKFDYKKHCLGNITKGIYPQKRQVFLDYSSCRIDECLQCTARFICGGPCYATSHLYYDNIYHTFPGQCHYMKQLIPVVKYVYSKLLIENGEALQKILKPLVTETSCC